MLDSGIFNTNIIIAVQKYKNIFVLKLETNIMH